MLNFIKFLVTDFDPVRLCNPLHDFLHVLVNMTPIDTCLHRVHARLIKHNKPILNLAVLQLAQLDLATRMIVPQRLLLAF